LDDDRVKLENNGLGCVKNIRLLGLFANRCLYDINGKLNTINASIGG